MNIASASTSAEYLLTFDCLRNVRYEEDLRRDFKVCLSGGVAVLLAIEGSSEASTVKDDGVQAIKTVEDEGSRCIESRRNALTLSRRSVLYYGLRKWRFC
jgi:hypothetical protein